MAYGCVCHALPEPRYPDHEYTDAGWCIGHAPLHAGAFQDGVVGPVPVHGDLLDIAYHGTLAQWNAFLAGSMPGTPATVLRGASFKQQADKISLAVDGIKADWPAGAVLLDKQTELSVEPGWTVEDGKTELHVRRIVLAQPESPNPMLVLNRYERAFDDSPQTAISFWHDLMTHAHPYDGQLIDRDDRRYMIHVFDPAAPDTARHAYALTYGLKDKTAEADILAHLTAAQKTTTLP